jgi:hypothetical protein
MEYSLETLENGTSMEKRALRRKILLDLLGSGDIDRAVAELRQLPGRRFVYLLLSALSSDDKTKWHAITVMGILVADLAGRDLESARVVMRTLMWHLTPECGGIAWGVPESMGEIMSCHETLADEYVHILVSYMRKDGNFLEYEPLQRGLMWGIGRVAQVRPELLLANDAGCYLLPYLESDDSTVRGLAAWALGLIRTKEAGTRLETLREDHEKVQLYLDRKLVMSSVGNLARQALRGIMEYRSQICPTTPSNEEHVDKVEAKIRIQLIPKYSFAGCPWTRHHTRRCLRICRPNEAGHGSCGRIAPHSVKGSIQQAILDYQKKSEQDWEPSPSYRGLRSMNEPG